MEGRTLLAVTPGTPDLVAAFDTGPPGQTGFDSDNLTNRNNSSLATALQFDVSGTIPGATVSILADGVGIGSVTATGTTTRVPTNGASLLADGARAITATQTMGATTSAPSLALTVTVDATGPAATIQDVTPDPRDAAVDAVTIAFNEPVFGFDPADLTLTRDGAAVPLAGATLDTIDNNVTWTLGNLAGLTDAEGTYVLGLTAAGWSVTDAAGNTLAAGDSESFVVDFPPAADILDVAPDPRNVPVGAITIVFSEPVTGFDPTDLTLTRNGAAVPLAGATLATADNVTWTLDGLAVPTAADGTYVLALTAAGSGIQDAGGNALAADAADTFVVDATPPAADILDVTPDPRNGAVGVVTIQFTEPVTGFDLADLILTRNGASRAPGRRRRWPPPTALPGHWAT